ncbi:hypothetical protein GCM10027440_34360 [Nocardiopsis coralliicola]
MRRSRGCTESRLRGGREGPDGATESTTCDESAHLTGTGATDAGGTTIADASCSSTGMARLTSVGVIGDPAMTPPRPPRPAELRWAMAMPAVQPSRRHKADLHCGRTDPPATNTALGVSAIASEGSRTHFVRDPDGQLISLVDRDGDVHLARRFYSPYVNQFTPAAPSRRGMSNCAACEPANRTDPTGLLGGCPDPAIGGAAVGLAGLAAFAFPPVGLGAAVGAEAGWLTGGSFGAVGGSVIGAAVGPSVVSGRGAIGRNQTARTDNGRPTAALTSCLSKARPFNGRPVLTWTAGAWSGRRGRVPVRRRRRRPGRRGRPRARRFRR